MAITTKYCDFLVIGGGSGGLASAKRATGRYGAKVIVVEAKRLGGTCVNVGQFYRLLRVYFNADRRRCIPKKITWNAANLAHSIRDAKSHGFSIEQTAPFDRASFKKKREAIIKTLNSMYERNLEKDGVENIHGRARLVGRNEFMIKLNDGTEIKVKAKKILLATGGHPTVPHGIPGSEYGIDSDGFFQLDHQPKKVANQMPFSRAPEVLMIRSYHKSYIPSQGLVTQSRQALLIGITRLTHVIESLNTEAIG